MIQVGSIAAMLDCGTPQTMTTDEVETTGTAKTTEQQETNDTSVEEPKTTDQETTATEEGEKVEAPAAKKTIKKKKAPSKRGQGRPFAKLPQENLESRIKKLHTRMQRSKAIYDKAEVYYSKYVREAELRKKDAEDK